MKLVKPSPIKKFIGLSFPLGACNLKCSYCYIGTHGGKVQDIVWNDEEIRKAFSKKRIGCSLINICSNGETLIHERMPSIIRILLEEGHYVMVLTNGTLTNRINECLAMDKCLLERLFFKISFHYEECLRLNILQKLFDNIQKIKESPCSLTVEYITEDKTLENIEKFKKICIENLGTLPQLNMPRDERRYNLGVTSKSSWENYTEKWEKEISSEFFKYREQFFGRRYKDYCYTGARQLWIEMETGNSRQCYHTPVIQNFMKARKIIWQAVGHTCPEAHCYVAHSHISLGIVPFPKNVVYKATYDEIRNRVCIDGTEWIKPIYKEAFQNGVEEWEYNPIEKLLNKYFNQFLYWIRREIK